MSIGVVKEMHTYVYKTPNKGILIDLQTGTEYEFERSADTSRRAYDWNVKEKDAVTFDISDSKAINVVLLRKHRDGIVFSYKA